MQLLQQMVPLTAITANSQLSLYTSFIIFISIYIKESRVSYTIYKSRTAEPIWLKIGGEVA